MYDEEKNLLARLHKLASRQDENFLTEAFAHLLRYLRDHEPQVAVEILSRLTGNRLKIEAEGIREKLTITTQVTTEQGRPDIEIAIQHVFRCFVEVKSQSGVCEEQLERYHDELKNCGVPNTALVLLTRYPAESFAADEHCRWYQITDWLEECEKALTRTDSKFLTNQFVDFLKMRNIAMEKAGPELAAGVKSLRNILKMLEEAIDAKTDNAKGYYKFKPEWDHIGFDLDNKTFWIGIHYEEPSTLCCETLEGFSVKKDAEKKAGYGAVKSDDNGLYWSHELKLDSTLFGLSKNEQMKCLEKFVGECLDATKKIKGR